MVSVLARRLTLRSLTLVACETALIVLAVGAAAYVRLGWAGALDVVEFENGVSKALLTAAIVQVCLYYADLYDMRRLADRRELFTRLLNALASASLVLAALYYWFPALIIGRGVFVIATAFVIAFVVGWRVAFEWVSRRVRPRERLLVVGTTPASVQLATEIYNRRHELGVEIMGFIDPDPARMGSPVLNPGVVGAIDDIPAVVRDRKVDRVVVSLADARGKLPMEKLLDLRLDGVNFVHLASIYEEYTGKIAVENLRPSWLLFADGFRKTRVLTAAKRLLDVTAAGASLVLALPLMALVALAVKLTSPGPIFYHQQRVGHHGRVFTIHKFRSMRQDAEATTGPVWASKQGDARVTPIGGVLRRTRLDELPQLWNVLRGDMSFVGPRPERPEFVRDLTTQIPFYRQRHIVRPGITGWAQVRYTYGATAEDALEKLQYDLYYIKNLSIALDLFIIMSTVKTVLLRRGA
jgi:sugar transferase (PEP-CTERM system associated)